MTVKKTCSTFHRHAPRLQNRRITPHTSIKCWTSTIVASDTLGTSVRNDFVPLGNRGRWTLSWPVHHPMSCTLHGADPRRAQCTRTRNVREKEYAIEIQASASALTVSMGRGADTRLAQTTVVTTASVSLPTSSIQITWRISQRHRSFGTGNAVSDANATTGIRVWTAPIAFARLDSTRSTPMTSTVTPRWTGRLTFSVLTSRSFNFPMTCRTISGST
mmetsp:Transcript_37162/g.54683  ORF Transcript_37162/g.54683 Transcript_37162/m.54683 type:complete len:218 (+) Transcript_37162:364-1017(+)